ncbi:MAG TPA: hypothetical protein VI756_02480 [Blastocatellia bacterium]
MRSRWKVWLSTCFVFLAVFAIGSVAGALLDGVYRTHATFGRAAMTVTTPSIKDGEAYLRVLDGELHLTASQAQDLREILNETRQQYTSLCGELKPRYNSVRDLARQRIRALLTPEQQNRFDTFVTQENCNCPDQKTG